MSEQAVPSFSLKRPIPLIVMGLFLMPLIAVVLFTVLGTFEVHEPLPGLGQVKSFRLLERNGGDVHSEDFRGKVWVASFVFTHCPTQCPLIMQQLKEIQRLLRFKENFRLVSITVDPKNDSVGVLKDYANQWQADPYKWLFLTGKPEEIEYTVMKGFLLPFEGEGASLTHSSKLVLVDHQLNIRGYYDANEPKEVKKLVKDARYLLKRVF